MPSAGIRKLLESARIEIVPMAGLESAIDALPPASSVTVTCSPVKGIDATLQVAERLVAGGHNVVPHLAARLVPDPAAARKLADRIEALGITEVFVVAGDASEPAGEYSESLPFLADFLGARGPSLRAVGVAAYPGGHPMADPVRLMDLLHAKQELLSELGLAGHVTTQICFSASELAGWLEDVRNQGITLPIHLGLAGPLQTTQLLRVGARIGVGSSLRYLRKNKRMLAMVGPGRYDPAGLLVELGDRPIEFGVTALHLNSFNQVESLVAWSQSACRAGEG